MSPILGNVIALTAVALLVAACVRNLRKDAKQGACSGCSGCSAGQCPHCASMTKRP